MKKADIVNLITAHYENDPRLFFHVALKILKEFKEDGDDALVSHLDFILKSRVKIAPKREISDTDQEISWDLADSLGWVPQETETKNG